MKKYTAVYWEWDYDQSGWIIYKTIDWEKHKEEEIEDQQKGWGGSIKKIRRLTEKEYKEAKKTWLY